MRESGKAKRIKWKLVELFQGGRRWLGARSKYVNQQLNFTPRRPEEKMDLPYSCHQKKLRLPRRIHAHLCAYTHTHI